MDKAEPSEMDFGKESQSNVGSDIDSIEPEKVITSIHLSLETTEFDSTIKDLNNIIGKNVVFKKIIGFISPSPFA